MTYATASRNNRQNNKIPSGRTYVMTISSTENTESNMPVIEHLTKTEPEILTPKDIQLPASHRCDLCGMQAWVEAEVPFVRTTKHINLLAWEEVSEQDKMILLFCAHHYRDSEAALKEKAMKIVDYRGTLEAQEKAGGPAL